MSDCSNKPYDIEMIQTAYAGFAGKVKQARALLGRSLTYTEKVLYTHISGSFPHSPLVRGLDYVYFSPDRVAMQDATAQMALLQFMQARVPHVAVPSSVHCDHLILAKEGAQQDISESKIKNKEIFDFLANVSRKYGIGFWKPGAGIIHQVIFENYAFPGGMMIGTDSHTVNAGGLGMVAIGVGGADAVDVMAGMPWELKYPKLIGVKLTGKMNGWTSAKDVILKVAGMLSVKGGTGCILEYFGDGATSISATGKGTICNMGAEIGATTSLFGFDKKMSAYLRVTGRESIAEIADSMDSELTGDPEVYAAPEKFFDQVLEINLSELEPHINGPFSPDKAWPLSQFAKAVKENGYPVKLEAGLIGSCTNSSYEDITRAASVARQAEKLELRFHSDFIITPGSEQIRSTIERDGLLDTFTKTGGMVLANACGPCIGQWVRKNAEQQKKNSIITSFNRNFAKRNDGNPNTYAFVASPEIVTALSIAGDITFNPITDFLTNEKGEKVKLQAPQGTELPPHGFVDEHEGFVAPVADGSSINIEVDPKSERLQLLEPFPAWDGKDFTGLRLLIKVKGKCTTDHISMAGPWLRYRGHLDHISDNLLIGAVNAFNQETNKVKNQLTGQYVPVPEAARAYKLAGTGSLIVGDENYGEGSSREHAAMEPRFLGVKIVLVRSFARIHETNLKKQGILALTFADPADYEKIKEDDIVDITGLSTFKPGKQLTLILHHPDGKVESIPVNHSYNKNQIEWFKAGASLNLLSQSAQCLS